MKLLLDFRTGGSARSSVRRTESKRRRLRAFRNAGLLLNRTSRGGTRSSARALSFGAGSYCGSPPEIVGPQANCLGQLGPER